MFHKVTIIGNLGSEPETRFLPSGASVCSFSVATNRTWTNSDGSRGEETIWWRVNAWGRLGEICQQYLNKGRSVFLEGTMVPDKESGGPRVWTGQDGQPRASFEIRVDTMKMLGGRDDNFPTPEQPQQQRAPARSGQGQGGGGRRSTMSAPQEQADTGFDDEFGPDEIPF